VATQMETDFYALLGVERNASDAELKKAYRKLARELHPDANPNDPGAEERFKQVTLAYEVLRDPERRRRYDQFGIDGVRGGGGSGTAGGDPFGFSGDVNLGDLFDAFFGGQSPFGGRRTASGPPSGSDMQATVTLPFEQAVFGGETEVKLKLPVSCDVCEGTGAAPGTEARVCADCQGQGEVRRVRQSILGQVVTASPCMKCHGTGADIASPCPTCHGEGRKTEERTYTVEIPAGIDNGQTLRLTGKGGAGPRGGPSGDLYIHVNVRPHDKFARREYDLVHELHVTMAQAALGIEMKLETLDDSEDIALEPGTQTGKVFHFRGKGVPHVNGRGRGDLIVAVVVDTPTKLTKDQEELLRSFADLRGEQVSEAGGLIGKLKGAFK
jgi:molecular chaperone DnaJ